MIKKRIIATILTIVMCFSAMPVFASQELIKNIEESSDIKVEEWGYEFYPEAWIIVDGKKHNLKMVF